MAKPAKKEIAVARLVCVHCIRIICALAVLALCACIPRYNSSDPYGFLDIVRPLQTNTSWEEYGAYYEIDDLLIEQLIVDIYIPQMGVMHKPRSKTYMHKKIRILTQEGTRHATVPIGFWGDIDRYTFKIQDADGRDVSFRQSSVLEKYKTEGILNFPNVTAGCAIDMIMEFDDVDPVTTYEHWFGQAIPVLFGRFTFSTHDQLKYNFNEYNLAQQMQSTSKEHTYYTWSIENYVPRSTVSDLPAVDQAEPRVCVALREGFGQGVYRTWDDIAQIYRKKISTYDGTIHYKENPAAAPDSMSRGYTRAAHLFSSLTRSVSHDESIDKGLENLEPGAAIEKGQASTWEMVLALKDYFDREKLATDIVISRPRTLGGFDPQFVSPSFVSVPLVCVRIDSAEYAAFPFERGGMLGDYPSSFFGLHGLSLSSGACRPLPAPRSSIWESVYDYRLDISQSPPVCSLRMSYIGYAAYAVRSYLENMTHDQRNEYFQETLGRLGPTNVMRSCDIVNLDDCSTPLEIVAVLTSDDMVIERKAMKAVMLRNLFIRYYDGLDSSRISPYSQPVVYATSERLEIQKGASRRADISGEPCAISTALFEYEFTHMQTDSSLIIMRTCRQNPGTFDADTVRMLLPAIADMNSVKEMNLVLK